MTDKNYQPTIAGLRAFVAVAGRQNFSSAAAELGVSQSTLSQALAALEAGLGVQLFERSTRRVFPTPAGRELLPYAQAVIEATAGFVAAASGVFDPLRRGMRLGLIPTVAPYVLPAMLAGLADRLPDLRLQVVEDQTERLLAGLRDGSLDAALLALPVEVAGVTEIGVYAEDFVLALPAGHPLAGRHGVSPAALAELPLLLLDEGHCLRDQALDVCRAAGVRAGPVNTRAASLTTAVQCVAGGLGVTLIPQTAVSVEADRSRLDLAYFAEPCPGRRIGLVYRSTSGQGEPYRRLAGIIGELVGSGQDVRVLTPAG